LESPVIIGHDIYNAERDAFRKSTMEDRREVKVNKQPIRIRNLPTRFREYIYASSLTSRAKP
jgi:hypothetical protein